MSVANLSDVEFNLSVSQSDLAEPLKNSSFYGIVPHRSSVSDVATPAQEGHGLFDMHAHHQLVIDRLKRAATAPPRKYAKVGSEMQDAPSAGPGGSMMPRTNTLDMQHSQPPESAVSFDSLEAFSSVAVHRAASDDGSFWSKLPLPKHVANSSVASSPAANAADKRNFVLDGASALAAAVAAECSELGVGRSRRKKKGDGVKQRLKQAELLSQIVGAGRDIIVDVDMDDEEDKKKRKRRRPRVEEKPKKVSPAPKEAAPTVAVKHEVVKGSEARKDEEEGDQDGDDDDDIPDAGAQLSRKKRSKPRNMPWLDRKLRAPEEKPRMRRQLPADHVAGADRVINVDLSLVTEDMLYITPSHISLMNLMDVGFLCPGDKVDCLGTQGTITDLGAIVLEDGVTVFDKPSPFATYANKKANRSEKTRLNGWAKASAPVVVTNVGFPSFPSQKFGVTLHELRETFKRMVKEVVTQQDLQDLRANEEAKEQAFGEVVNVILQSSSSVGSITKGKLKTPSASNVIATITSNSSNINSNNDAAAGSGDGQATSPARRTRGKTVFVPK